MLNIVSLEGVQFNLENDKQRFADIVPYAALKQMRGHMHHFCVEMRSEDGTNFLQGFAVLEVYRTARGVCSKLQALWVAPECRNMGFGKALLENLIRMANEKIHRDAMDANELDYGYQWLAVMIGIIPNGLPDAAHLERLLKGQGFDVDHGARNVTFSRNLLEWVR